MRLTVFAVLVLTLLACKENHHSGMTLTELELQILDSLHQNEGEFAIIFQNLDSVEQALYINKKTMFHAASTMKTPVMIEAYKQAHLGKISLDDTLLITNRFRSIVDSSWYELTPDADSELQLYNQIGEPRTIKELINLMITESSNIASNMLVQHLGATNITTSMREMGAKDMHVLRGVEDIKAFEQSLSNITNASSLAIIFEKLAREEVVSAEASREMLDILKDQRFKDVIPAKLPKDVVVAHKTGTLSQAHHDSGIVYLPDGRRYILVMMSKNLLDFERSTELLSNLSLMIYQYMEQESS